jgi:hypothetical protein
LTTFTRQASAFSAGTSQLFKVERGCLNPLPAVATPAPYRLPPYYFHLFLSRKKINAVMLIMMSVHDFGSLNSTVHQTFMPIFLTFKF